MKEIKENIQEVENGGILKEDHKQSIHISSTVGLSMSCRGRLRLELVYMNADGLAVNGIELEFRYHIR